MRRRLCLVRVHPELTNVFFFFFACVLLHWTPDELWRLHNEAEADNLHASSPAISPHRTTSSKTPSPPPPPRVCCAGPCDGCPATAPSGSASGSASSTPVRVSTASPSRASFHQASRRHHLVPVSWNGNPSEVLVVLQPLEDTSNNFLVSSALSFLSFVSLLCLNLYLWF